MAGVPVVTKTQALTIPAATAPGIYSFPFDTPSDYKRVAGFYVQRNQGSDYLKITVKDSNGVNMVDPVNIKFLNGGLTQGDNNILKIEDKMYRRTPFKAGGTKMVVQIQVFTLTAALQDMDFVYECDQVEI